MCVGEEENSAIALRLKSGSDSPRIALWLDGEDDWDVIVSVTHSFIERIESRI